MPKTREAAMARAKRRPPWIVRSLIALTVIMVAAVLWHSWTRPPAEALVATPPNVPPARICVTRHGACPIGLVRAGDPCTCWYSIHGNVRGRVELVRGANDRNRPGQDEDPLESLCPLYGP